MVKGVSETAALSPQFALQVVSRTFKGSTKKERSRRKLMAQTKAGAHLPLMFWNSLEQFMNPGLICVLFNSFMPNIPYHMTYSIVEITITKTENRHKN